MQEMKLLILQCFCFVLAISTSHMRQKRDTKSIINDALNLYYYGQNFKIPTIKLDTKNAPYCDASGFGGFYLADIIGQADNVASLDDCLNGCMNIKECVAVNYVENLKQCIALKSRSVDGSDLLNDKDLTKSSHYFFEKCPSKTSKPASKPPAGDAPKGCGLPYFQQNILASAKTRIIGGSEAVPYSYPWIGRLKHAMKNNMLGFCGSSLIMGSSSIESDLVITAAHCVVNSDKTDGIPNNFTLYFGNHDNRFLEPQEQVVGVKKVISNPDYKTYHTGDIAILKLKTPIKFNNYTRPICLPNAGQVPKDKKNCVAVGWGRLSNSNNNTPDRLQQTKLPMLDDQICAGDDVWGEGFDDTTMTCAGPLDGTFTTCQGDSGGPLACFEDGHWTLYGATSFGNGEKVNGFNKCAAENKPAVFARISGLRPWIDQTINEMKKY